MPPTATPKEIETLIEARSGAARLEIPAEAIPMLAVHLAMTLEWVRVTRLTSIRSVEEAVDRHVVESVLASRFVDPDRGRLLDIGSGNGYPGIPIKCLKPALRVLLLEPLLRRSIFLKQVVTALSLRDVEVRRERVDRPEDLERYAPLGSITMRGVALVEEVARGAAGALAKSGRLVLLVGQEAAETVASLHLGELRQVERCRIPGRRRSEILVLERRS